MGDVTGTQTKAGLALEPAFAAADATHPPLPVPTQMQGLLDFRNIGVAGSNARIESQAIRPSRYRRKGVPGNEEVTGGISYEVTPTVCSKLLFGALGAYNGSGPTGANPYVHALKPIGSGALPTLTLARSVGSLIVYQAGCYVNTLTFRGALDEILTAEAAILGLREVYDKNGIDLTHTGATDRDASIYGTAAYATGDPFVFHQAIVQIGDTIGASSETFETRGIDIELNNNLMDKRVLRRARNAVKYTGRRFETTATLDNYFDTEYAIRKALGAAATGYPFESGQSLGIGAVLLEYSNGTDILRFELSNCEIETTGPTVETEDYIMQSVTFRPVEVINDASATPVLITLTNSETLIVPATTTPIA